MSWRRPLVWATAAVAVLATVCMPFNNDAGLWLVNHDPQGADQLVEVDYTTAVTWTADEQRLFAFERHEPAALAFACLLGGALLYATVVNLAALNRARINRRSARREG